MGLDMHIVGVVNFWKAPPERDGFEIREIHLQLAYWRKEWYLHHCIAERFGGDDD